MKNTSSKRKPVGSSLRHLNLQVGHSCPTPAGRARVSILHSKPKRPLSSYQNYAKKNSASGQSNQTTDDKGLKRTEDCQANHCPEQTDDQKERFGDLPQRAVVGARRSRFKIIGGVGSDRLRRLEIILGVVLHALWANVDPIFDWLTALFAGTHGLTTECNG